MKFFHLSDLHIGKQLHFYPLLEDQKYILEQVAEQAEAEKPDAVVIAGDIYDRPVPSAEAVSLFDWFLRRMRKACPGVSLLVIAGNHDSPRRLGFASSILEREGVLIAGMPPEHPREFLKKAELTDRWGRVCFWLLPFVKPGYAAGVFPGEEPESYEEALRRLLEREKIDPAVRNVLVTHQFYTASGREPEKSESESVHVGGVDNVDVRVLEPFCYAAMGHLHRPQAMGRPVYRYCGTLLPYSVSEGEEEKSLTVVTLREPGTEPEIRTVPLTPLRRVRSLRGTLAELLEQAPREGSDDYVSLTLTDEQMPYQPREQLEQRFRRILEIRVENTRTRRQAEEIRESRQNRDPLELFADFYREMQGQEMTEEQRSLLKEILKQAEEEWE